MMMSAPARLDPVGRPRGPRRSTLLRLAVVAVLLLTAAGVLYLGGTGSPAAGPTPASTPTPAGTPTPADTPSAEPTRTPAAERLPIPDGMVGVPVLIDDPASLALLRPGDRVDLLAVSGAGVEPVTLASAAQVLAVDRSAAGLLVALTPDQGHAVVSSQPDTAFVVVLRAGPEE